MAMVWAEVLLIRNCGWGKISYVILVGDVRRVGVEPS